MPQRRPRQPKKMARKYRRSAVAPNPKNIKFIDRQLVPYKSAVGNIFKPAYNSENFQYSLPPQTANFGVVAASTVQSKNTKVFLGALYNRNTTALEQNIMGQYLCPKFYTDKYRISFDDIVADHADSAQGFKLRMHVIQIKIAPHKDPTVTTDSLANWSTTIEAMVNREVADSNLNSDYLDFSQRSRNMRIISTKDITPNRNGMIRKVISPSGSNEVYSAPPPVCLTVRHQIPQFKQKLSDNGQVNPMCEQMYVNCVLFTCDQLTSNTGTFKIEHSSKFYFTDN